MKKRCNSEPESESMNIYRLRLRSKLQTPADSDSPADTVSHFSEASDQLQTARCSGRPVTDNFCQQRGRDE